MCQAVRAPGSKVTRAPATRAGSGGLNSGSMRTVPVNYSAGPLPDGCAPLRLISIVGLLLLVRVFCHRVSPAHNPAGWGIAVGVELDRRGVGRGIVAISPQSITQRGRGCVLRVGLGGEFGPGVTSDRVAIAASRYLLVTAYVLS